MLENYWLIHITGSQPVPVPVNQKLAVEEALVNPATMAVYFDDIFGGPHIVPCKCIVHIEYSSDELRQRRADFNAEVHSIAGQAYFERRNVVNNKLQGEALGNMSLHSYS